MNAVTAHRGPDGTDFFVAPNVSLGHNRLAIIDLSPSGAQPMKSRDGRYVIVFNGEIYNYRELRNELSAYPFQSTSDTEVILAAYEAWGKKAFARLNGMFALALFDAKERKLILARDRVGIKPLYYHADGARLIFSSEIKALLEHQSLSRHINPLAFDIYMRLGYVPAPLTMFKGVQKLLPGNMLTHTNGTSTLTSFVEAKETALLQAPRAELAKQLYQKVHERVQSQLVSDRPIGLYLSGGIDSSVVLESMAAAQGRVETFSVGFELRVGEQAEKFNADFMLARRTAKHFGAKHHEVLVRPDEIIPLFEEAIYHLDEPVSNATIIPMHKLSRFAKTHVAVVLGGDGGDELFGGYERYRLSLLSSYYRRVPHLLRAGLNKVFPRVQKLDTEEGIARYAQFHFLKERIIRPLLSDEAYHEHSAEDFFQERFFKEVRLPFETQFMKVDRQSWLPDESLLRSDKLSMSGGLEARVPLLDLSLIEFADTVPLRHKVSLQGTKLVLKEAFRSVLPKELLNQPKRGWFSPGAKWLRYPDFAAYAREVLSPDYAEATRTLFNWATVQARLESHLRGNYHFTELWMILTLQVWARRYKISL